MPWENIGSCGTGQIPEDSDWIDFCYETAVAYLKLALGNPPSGCELDVIWHDHELGSYPSVGLWWEFPADEAPWDYIHQAEELLGQFDQAVEWSQLYPFPLPDGEDDEDEGDVDDREASENP